MKGWWRWGATVAVAGSVVVELRLPREAHGSFWWVGLPGFDLFYGFIGCVALVLASKALGAVWLQREEDYYRDDEP